MRPMMLLPTLALLGSCAAPQGFPGALGDDLAGQADAIAASFASGGACAAQARVDQLRVQADAAIARGDVPEPLIAPLNQRIAELEAVPCVPRPTPTPTPTATRDGSGDRRKGKGKGKG